MPITEQKLQKHRHFMMRMNLAGGQNRACRLANRENIHTHEPRKKPSKWGGKNITHIPN